MNLNYKKNNNSKLFENFKDKNILNLENPQNYIPIYNKFFSLNSNNFNSINLNNSNRIVEIIEKITENKYKVKIENLENNEITEKQVFFKLSPLLDPIKFLAGKYDINDENIYKLPNINNNNSLEKVNDFNNCSYVDGFFSYLSSELTKKFDFLHGIEFYGSFLGLKNNYIIDICDDMEFLEDKEFFYKNMNNIYSFLDKDYEKIINNDSRNNKKRLELNNENNIDISPDDIIELENNNLDNLNVYEDKLSIQLSEINLDDDLFTEKKTPDISDIHNSEDNLSNSVDDIINNIEEIDKDTQILKNNRNNLKSISKSSSTCSSRSSVTNNETESEESIESSNESSSSEEIDEIFINIKKFPIQIISLEQCNNTLDYLLVEDLVNEEELGCIMLQIIMILITYQKLFDFTHNDLHTNNIMYVETEKKYLYYKYNNQHYKIKTFGKIFKIIDFGRAIYKYNDVLMCSDSFHKDGDAATQYNFEPYFDDKKPKILPNPSFDLCRLGCSMLDYIFEMYDDIEKIKSPIHKIIINWCKDDKNRNILYKNDGEERYPDFKLYKMIARTVHNHKPSDEIKNKYFSKFIIGKKDINKSAKIFNIDTLEI